MSDSIFYEAQPIPPEDPGDSSRKKRTAILGSIGLVVLPFGAMLLTLGPRYLAAPEVAMLMLLETVVGPFWVWLVLAEEPEIRSLIGGAIIVATLFLHALVRFRMNATAGRTG